MRKDYIKRCISSAIFLASSYVTDEISKNIILQSANKMMQACWYLEYKSYAKLSSEQKLIKTKDFWDAIHTELVSNQEVNKFQAIFDATVNPVGTEGNVFVDVMPSKRCEYYRFKLNSKDPVYQ